MRFPYRVKELLSAQKNFDYLQSILSWYLKGEVGTVNLTWAASAVSATVVVNHRLGVVPRIVLVDKVYALIDASAIVRTSTTIAFQGYTTYNGALTAGPLAFNYLLLA